MRGCHAKFISFLLRDRCFARCKPMGLELLSEEKRSAWQEAFFVKKFSFFNSALITKAIISKESIITSFHLAISKHEYLDVLNVLLGSRNCYIYVWRIIDRSWKSFVMSIAILNKN